MANEPMLTQKDLAGLAKRFRIQAHKSRAQAARKMKVSHTSIVQCRCREWVLLPSDQENLLLLRPLTEAHRRIRQAVSLKVRGLTVKPHTPPDLLGLLILPPLIQKET